MLGTLAWCDARAVTFVNEDCDGCCKELEVWACPVRQCGGFVESKGESEMTLCVF